MKEHVVSRRSLLRAVTAGAGLAAGVGSPPSPAAAKAPNGLPAVEQIPEGGIVELARFQTYPPRQDQVLFGSPSAYLLKTTDPPAYPYGIGEAAHRGEPVSPLTPPPERAYVDGGALTYRGGAEDLAVHPRGPGRDKEGREHDVYYFEEHFAGAGDPERYLSADTEYEIAFAGSHECDPLTLPAGEGVYMPAPLQEISPGHPELLLLPRGRDFTWRWRPGPPPRDRGLRLYHFIGFTDYPAAAPATDLLWLWCVHEDTGEYVIPAEAIERLAQVAPRGTAVYGARSHRAHTLRFGDGQKKRRLDLYGAHYHLAPYQVVG